MDYINLSDNAYRLLVTLLESEDPSAFIRKQFDNTEVLYNQDLINIIQELVKYNFITVNWYDDIPYYIQINHSAKLYINDKNEKAKEEKTVSTYSNTIVIGNNNTIHNSSVSIGENHYSAADKTKKSFYQRHPIICGFLISLIAGLVLLFSFWSYIVKFIEGFF